MKVLVVESDKQTRLAIMEGLKRAGFKTFEAESNGEALSFIDQEIDVVVFDYAMMDRGGIDLIGEWKRRKPETKIIACGHLDAHESLEVHRRGGTFAFGKATHTQSVVDAIVRSSWRKEERKIKLPPGYTLESAKSLMDQGMLEHKKGKLTWAADAWMEAWTKWTKKRGIGQMKR